MAIIGATYSDKNGGNKVTVTRITAASIIYSVDNGRYESRQSHRNFASRYPIMVESEFGNWEPTTETNLADRKI